MTELAMSDAGCNTTYHDGNVLDVKEETDLLGIRNIRVTTCSPGFA